MMHCISLPQCPGLNNVQCYLLNSPICLTKTLTTDLADEGARSEQGMEEEVGE